MDAWLTPGVLFLPQRKAEGERERSGVRLEGGFVAIIRV
jgi:hypothetical protein